MIPNIIEGWIVSRDGWRLIKNNEILHSFWNHFKTYEIYIFF